VKWYYVLFIKEADTAHLLSPINLFPQN